MAATFKDRFGNAWTVEFNLGHAAPLRKLGIEFQNKDVSFFDKLSDFDLWQSVFSLLLSEQLKAKNIAFDKFLDGIDGPTLHAANEAFLEAWVGVAHRPEHAVKIKAELPKFLRLMDAAAGERIGAAMENAAKSITSKEPTPAPAG